MVKCTGSFPPPLSPPQKAFLQILRHCDHHCSSQMWSSPPPEGPDQSNKVCLRQSKRDSYWGQLAILQLAREAGLGNCESCLQAQGSHLNCSCSTAVKKEVYSQMNSEKDSLTTTGRRSAELWHIPPSGRGSPDKDCFLK